MLDLYCYCMKFLTEYLTFKIKTRRGFVNITSDISKLVSKSKIQEGLCLVNAMHITASVFINDNAGSELKILIINQKDRDHHSL